MTEDSERSRQIQELNDAFRTTLTGGVVLLSAGIISKGAEFQEALLQAVRNFNDFDEDCDPWQEHDFGAIRIEGSRVFWKIDYFDCLLSMRSDDPADPSITKRVMTIMLAEEY
jgi:hypothetical protein